MTQTEEARYDQKVIADMCKEIYKENMGHFRYFGTLRARIAYVPATIGLTVVALFITANQQAFIAKLVFSFVLFLIFVMNYILQRHQQKCKNISKFAQNDWREISSKSAASPVSSSEYATRAKKEAKIWPDSASIILLLFLTIVGATAWVGLDGAASLDCLLPT